MSAHLYFSNSPGVLLDKLSGNLEWSDPFLSPHIATPTPAMKRWVQMRLAEKRGIVANVDFMQLERTLWQRLEALDAFHVVSDRKPARLLDEQGLQLLILGYLRSDPPDEAREYLERTGSEGAHGVLHARRLCQLSRKLAGFFREYEYSRVQEHGHEGLARLWKQGRDCFLGYLGPGASAAERAHLESLERWQKRIYHALFRPGGLRDALGEKLGQYLYTLPQYAEMVLEQERTPGKSQGKPPSYHLFGLSQISPFHRSLIRRLADPAALPGNHARFFIYSLNPCAEYWEDALTPGERLRQQRDLFGQKKFVGWRDLGEGEKANLRLPDQKIQEEELHLEANENPLLSRWGKPGRENIQLWCQVTQYDFSEYFREAESRTLLSAIQDSVLHRRGRLPDEERVAQDDTLQILACPEIHREAETVHQGILDALLREPSLRPDDIAVLVPNMDKYRHVLAAVFGRTAEGEPGHVAFNLSDASASAESDYARAVRGLFALARGRFSRREVFALAANPCFRGAGPLDDAALHAWSGWTAKLNIFHGFDGEDKRSRGYAADTLHTWTHGLERLVLGTVMESPEEDDARHFRDVVPFADGRSQDRDLLEGFLTAVRGLNRDLAPLRGEAPRPWSEWLDRCEALFESYLEAPEDNAMEGFVKTDLHRYLTELRSMDVLESLAAPHAAGSPQTYGQVGSKTSAGVVAAIPLDLILERLDGLKAGREPHLSGGVNVAGLGALRSLPFKLVYVLGLGEGEFPEEDTASTLDLRRYRRVIGDVDPAARNRYLFLETLLCATGKLRLSYVSRDVQQGKVFQMGSVLNELADYVQDCVLAPGRDGKPGEYRITQVPLLSRAPSLFPGPAPAASAATAATAGTAAGAMLPWDPPPNPFREERILSWLESKRAAHPELPRWLAERADRSPFRELFPIRPVQPILPTRPTRTTRTDTPLDPETGPVTALPLDDLRLYLENPAQYALRKRLGIRDDRDEDPMAQEDEPFFCPAPLDLDLLQRVAHRRIAWGAAGTREQSRAHFLSMYENLALRGMMPGGPFRDLDQDQLWARAEAVLDGLDKYFEGISKDGRVQECMPGLVLGDGSGRGLVHRMRGIPVLRFPALGLRAADRELELHGELPCLFRDVADGRCATLVFMGGQFSPRRLLPAFLFYAAGVASETRLGEWLRAAPFTIHYVHKKYSKYETGNWAPFRLTRDEATTWLKEVAESMLTGTDFDLLPFDLIAGELAPQGALLDGHDYAQILRASLEDAADSPDWFARDLPESQVLLNPRVPDDAEAKIRSRLAIFFNFKPGPPREG
ncbi:MAG: exodeoxyribonuclease V subunit gamma [Fibrobacteria bacterium]